MIGREEDQPLGVDRQIGVVKSGAQLDPVSSTDDPQQFPSASKIHARPPAILRRLNLAGTGDIRNRR